MRDLIDLIEILNLVQEAPDYRMRHSAPCAADGDCPLYDLTEMFPEDVYGPKGYRYGGAGTLSARASHQVVLECRNQPDRLVTMYRAIPDDIAEAIIHPGDWVAIDREYTETHGVSNLNGRYRIISQAVPARDLYTNGALVEWGYDPQGSSSIEQP